MLKFNDNQNWLNERINGVLKAYLIPIKFESKKPIAVDVGSNVGAFPIVNHNKFFKVICYEPSSYSFNECRKNVNDLKNVEVFNFAVSDKSNNIVKLKSYKLGNVSGNASTLDSDLWDDTQCEMINTISLEDIFINNNLSKIDYLKVDCEGGEYDFLINKDLSKIDYIAIEIHIQLNEKAFELINYLDKYFIRISELGNGKTIHYEITYKNKKLL